MTLTIPYNQKGIQNDRFRSVLRIGGLALTLLLSSQPNSLCEEPTPARAVSPKPEVVLENNAANKVWENAIPLDPQREDWLRSELFSGRTEAWSKMQSERALTQRVSELESQCQLTSDQTKKLLLAGRGDIAKYFRDVESLYIELKPQASEAMDRKTLEAFIGSVDVQSRIKPLRDRWRSGLHNAGSLYQGVLKQTLTTEQLTKITSESQQREQLRLTHKLMAFVVNIEKSMPLTSNQRNRLLQKLQSSYSKLLESRSVNAGEVDDEKSDDLAAQESYRLTEADLNLAGLVSAMMLRQVDLEEFLDSEQVKTMLALQRHWRLNVPPLDAIEDIK